MIVQDVVPVGSPVESERYEAVTEPWMLWPPLNAAYPAGQSTVNCLEPDVCESVEVMMAEPSRPAGPCGPVAPAGPAGPAAPGAPGAPGAPCEPAGPAG